MIMLISVVTVFFLSWSPVSVFGFFILFRVGFSTGMQLQHYRVILVFLSFSYSAITPYIYYIFNEQYREGHNDIMSCKFLKNEASPPSKIILCKGKRFL